MRSARLGDAGGADGDVTEMSVGAASGCGVGEGREDLRNAPAKQNVCVAQVSFEGSQLKLWLRVLPERVVNEGDVLESEGVKGLNMTVDETVSKATDGVCMFAY